MTTMPVGPEAESLPNSANRLVACTKCGHGNSQGRHVCAQCGAHLHISCPRCGHHNRRSSPACAHCGQRLHQSFWKKVEKKWLGRRRRISFFQMGLLIVVVTIVYLIIISIAEFEPPAPHQ